jgi:hypothetical protein
VVEGYNYRAHKSVNIAATSQSYQRAPHQAAGAQSLRLRDRAQKVAERLAPDRWHRVRAVPARAF